MTTAEQRLRERMERAGWRDPSPVPQNDRHRKDGSPEIAGYSDPDRAYRIRVDGDPTGYPEGYQITRAPQPGEPAGSPRAVPRQPCQGGRIPTPEEASGVWEQWRVGEG